MPISQVSKFKLHLNASAAGWVKTFLHSGSAQWATEGEIYFTHVKKNSVKGWNCHRRLECNLACVNGKVSVAVVTGDQERLYFDLSQDDSVGLTIPPNHWFAFKSNCEHGGTLVNMLSGHHDPSEVLKKTIDAFVW